MVFLAAGLWRYARAGQAGPPYAGALLLYAASQLGFFAYFADAITMKMAVLAGADAGVCDGGVDRLAAA